jgi:hypothetical protein
VELAWGPVGFVHHRGQNPRIDRRSTSQTVVVAKPSTRFEQSSCLLQPASW